MPRLSHSGISAIDSCPFRLILQLKHPGGGDYEGYGLHKLNTIPGHAIHLAIAEFIDRWKDDSSVTPRVSELVEFATSIINTIWENKDTEILEFIQCVELDEDRNYHSEQLRKIPELCRKFCRIWNQNGYQNMQYISHERLESQPFNENYELSGEIDLLIRDDNGIYYVIDWKTGIASRVSLGVSQLGIYAYLTHHIHDVDFSYIHCIFVSLKEGSCIEREFQERDLKMLEKKIHGIMEIEQAYETGAYTDAEWAQPTEQNCLGCLYSNLCEFNCYSQ